MIKFVYAIDYPVGQKRAYIEWVRSISEIRRTISSARRLAGFSRVNCRTMPAKSRSACSSALRITPKSDQLSPTSPTRASEHLLK